MPIAILRPALESVAVCPRVDDAQRRSAQCGYVGRVIRIERQLNVAGDCRHVAHARAQQKGTPTPPSATPARTLGKVVWLSGRTFKTSVKGGTKTRFLTENVIL